MGALRGVRPERVHGAREIINLSKKDKTDTFLMELYFRIVSSPTESSDHFPTKYLSGYVSPQNDRRPVFYATNGIATCLFSPPCIYFVLLCFYWDRKGA